jgi:hypothetical protein
LIKLFIWAATFSAMAMLMPDIALHAAVATPMTSPAGAPAMVPVTTPAAMPPAEVTRALKA